MSDNITKMFSLAVMVVVIGVFASVTKAQEVVFWDNFESDIAGTSPTSDDLDPVIGAGDIGGNWLIDEGDPVGVQVVNNAAIADAPITGNNFLHITRGNPGEPNGDAWATGWDIAKTAGPQLVKLDFSLYMPSDGGRGFGFAMGGPNQWDEIATGVNFYEDGDIKNAKNNESPPIDLVIAIEEWQQASLLIDLVNKTFDVTVEGSTATGIPFRDALSTKIQWLLFSLAQNESHLYVDNVQLSVVPEPSAIALLGFSLTGVLVFARRRRR